MKELLFDSASSAPFVGLGRSSGSKLLVDPAVLDSIEMLAPAAPVTKTVRPAPGWWEALLWTVGFLFMSQIVPLVGLAIYAVGNGLDLEESAKVYCLPMLFAGQLLGIAWSLLGLRVRVGKNWTSALAVRRPALVPCLLAVLCLPAIVTLGSALGELAGNAVGEVEPTRELVGEAMAYYAFWFVILVVAVGPAIGEELFCRGLLGHGLVGRYGVWIGVLFTSLIFGAIHMNVPQGVYAVILGIGMHLAYLATRSLWVPVLMHFVNNLAATVMFVLFPNLKETDTHAWWIAIPAFAIGIVCALALYRLSNRKEVQLQMA